VPMELRRPFEAELPSILRRARDTVVCWFVLLRAKLVWRRGPDPQVEHCLQLRKGMRFRLNGGQVELLEEDGLQAAQAGVERTGEVPAKDVPRLSSGV
jgi:hypothetical protein